MTDVLHLGLESLRARITAVFPAQIRKCLDQLDDEQIWWRPNETSNSVGNLVLHLSGSLNHYLNHLIGGFDFAAITVARLGDPSPDAPKNIVVLEDLISIAVHISTHTGQILWITKMLHEGALDEVWMKTHKHLGGWRAT